MSRIIHERFDREVWAFKKDFTGACAKWLVKNSPYIVPDKLSVCLIKFDKKIDREFSFDGNGMVKIYLNGLTSTINSILESIPEIMELNERKNGRDGIGWSDRYSAKPDPDDDFIDIMALAQCITCEFAEEADARCWLDRHEGTLFYKIKDWWYYSIQCRYYAFKDIFRDLSIPESSMKQLDAWLEGKPFHDNIIDQCAPDFSCCNPDLLSPYNERKKYYDDCIEASKVTKFKKLKSYIINRGKY